MPAIHLTAQGKELNRLAVYANVSADELTPEGLLTDEQVRQCLAAAKSVMPAFTRDEFFLGYFDADAFCIEYLGENARPYCKQLLTLEALPGSLAGDVLELGEGRSLYRSRRIDMKGFAALEL